MSLRKNILAMGLFVSFSAFAASSNAADFPTAPVKIVPFGTAGGPIDTLARLYADHLKDMWGQPVIIESRPGASGMIAAGYVAKSAPDGYTVMLTLPLTHVNNPILLPEIQYDAKKDFEPIAMLGVGGPVIVARADAPYNNINELIEYAKTKGRLTYGTWGTGSAAHIYNEFLANKTGAPLDHVPYKSEAQVHLDLFGGRLDYGWANPATALMHTKDGKMKPLGIASTVRGSTFPDLPTLIEQGHGGFDMDSWLGFFAPAGTPKEIVQKWNQALRDITQKPEVQEKLRLFSFEPKTSTPEEFRARHLQDYDAVERVIKTANISIK